MQTEQKEINKKWKILKEIHMKSARKPERKIQSLVQNPPPYLTPPQCSADNAGVQMHSCNMP